MLVVGVVLHGDGGEASEGEISRTPVSGGLDDSGPLNGVLLLLKMVHAQMCWDRGQCRQGIGRFGVGDQRQRGRGRCLRQVGSVGSAANSREKKGRRSDDASNDEAAEDKPAEGIIIWKESRCRRMEGVMEGGKGKKRAGATVAYSSRGKRRTGETARAERVKWKWSRQAMGVKKAVVACN